MCEKAMPSATNKVIAVVGMAGSGKSAVSEFLRAAGLPVIRFGGIIVHEVEKRGLSITPQNERMIREELRKSRGMDVCAQIALPWIKEALRTSHVVIDGMYSFSEYKTLRKEFGDGLIVIAVYAPRKVRYERLALRAERPLTKSEAEERDYLEIERIEKGGPIALADHIVVNDGTLGQLESKLIALFDLLLE